MKDADVTSISSRKSQETSRMDIVIGLSVSNFQLYTYGLLKAGIPVSGPQILKLGLGCYFECILLLTFVITYGNSELTFKWDAEWPGVH